METIRKIWKKRWVRVMLIASACVLLIYLFRIPILRCMGNYLVSADPLQKTEAYFVLGGNSYERGIAAFGVYEQFPDAFFVTSGGNHPLQIQALDTVMTEAALTRHWMLKQGVPPAQIDTITHSTSTQEESEDILRYCKAHKLTHITLISSSFHLRRMRMVFEDKFRQEGITTRYLGASDRDFHASEWWKDELSLITLNNEYVKIIYYSVKY